jgi:MurNAc alpha-1-phosphate uridylyltransferase
MTSHQRASQTVMILAAGRGARMRPFTDLHPKPLVRLKGKPLIQYHVERLAAQGFKRIVINVAWLGSQVRAALGDGERFGTEILYSDEGPSPLETGGGIFRALPLLGDGPFWIVSADIFTNYAFSPQHAKLAHGDLAHLVMVANPDFHPQGDFCLAGGRLRESGGTRYTYANMALLDPKLFADCGPGVFPLAPLLIGAMRDDRVSGELYVGPWHNIGTIAQLEALERQLSTDT